MSNLIKRIRMIADNAQRSEIVEAAIAEIRRLQRELADPDLQKIAATFGREEN